MEEYLVGIDFGACNLKAAQFDGKKFRTVQLNADASGIKHTPNFIYYRQNKKSDGIEKIIGQSAINNSLTDTQQNFVANVKRKLEILNWQKSIPVLNKNLTAQEVISDIFTCMQKYFRPNGKQIRAVLTVPVAFSKVQRQSIRTAAENAGLIVDSLITEPFAALMSLKDLESYAGKLIMIYDFGGSTLDVSVAKIVSDGGVLKIHEQAAAGIKLGGLDIDRDILEKILMRDYKAEFDATYQDYTNRQEYFLRFAQDLKEMLFSSGDDEVEAGDLEKCITGLEDIILKKADVEEMFATGDYKAQIFKMLDALFEDLEESDDFYQKDDIAKIFPFGGTCQIPFFVDILQEYFGADIFNKDDFDFADTDILMPGLESRYLAVAGGAVKYLMSKLEGSSIDIVNAIPYCIGFNQGGKFKRVLNRSMPFGYSKTVNLSLKNLQQNGWNFEIYQCFNNQTNFSLADNGDAVFVENVHLNSALYEKQDSPILEMRMTREGKLQLKFQEYRNFDNGKKISREAVPIEDFVIDMGC